MVETKPTIFIVDDDAAFLDSMSALLASMGFQSRLYSSGEEFLSNFPCNTPGCLILDLKLPGTDGFAVIEALATKRLPPPVIIMTGKGEVPDVVKAMRHGVVAYLQKHSVSEMALFDAIQLALNKDAEQHATFGKKQELQSRLERLTDPEMLVFNLLVEGKDQAAIARILGVSRRTADNRRAKVMSKLEVTTMPELVQLAVDANCLQWQ